MRKRLLSCLLAFVMFFNIFTGLVFAGTNISIESVYVDKAKYSPGSTATITVEVKNDTSRSFIGAVNLDIYHLETLVYTSRKNIKLTKNTTENVTFNFKVPSTDYKGYLVKAYINDDIYKTTAIDCSSDVSRYPRYGYVAEYSENQSNSVSRNMINELARDYHISAVQFYDWMWRHDEMIKRNNNVVASTWEDLFGRVIDTKTIKDLVAASHEQNIDTMAYVMSYAAREGYDNYGVSPSWGLYNDRNHSSQMNVDFGNGLTYLWLFNPANDDWQKYIASKYQDAINTMGFDGLQIDQMGQRDNVYDYSGKQVYLEDTFSDLVNSSKDAVGNDKTVTFNIVDGAYSGWGMENVVKNADTDFDFSEIWYKSNSYSQIHEYIKQVRTENNGKALVLAAYMNYNDNCGTRYEAENAVLGSTSINTNHTGYTGTGFVDDFTVQGDYVEFTIDAKEDGLYPLVFSYANATGNSTTRNVYVDGVKESTIIFKSLSNWDTWNFVDSYCTVPLIKGTHTVKLVYDTENTGAINLDSLTIGEFNKDSVLLTDAVFAASGAYHIEIGANKTHATMLPHEYYASTSKTMRDDLRTAMIEYYDFITAYENLLYDADINYGDRGTQFIEIENHGVSGSGEKGKIYTLFSQKENIDIIHLINLTNEKDTMWRNETVTPVTLTNLDTKYYIGTNKTVTGVFVASPDINEGLTKSIPYNIGKDNKGTYVRFTVGSLKYWDMVYINCSNLIPEDGIYEAEDATKQGTAINTDHTGYTGTGFVDQFNEKNDSVSFNINVPETMDYTLKFRYANATGQKAARSLFIDGEYKGTVYMDSLRNWDTWGIGEIGVRMTKGQHQVVLLYGDYEYTDVNLDYMRVEALTETARSLYMNNWSNIVYLWKDTCINKAKELMNDGPSIYELRYYEETEADNYNINQIKNYSTFIRNETNKTKMTDGSKFRSTGYFGKDGVLYNEYITYNEQEIKPEIKKAYAALPEENIIITKYTVKNTYKTTKTFKILDMLHVNNTSDNLISATYNKADNYATIDMTNSGQYIMVHGTLDDIDGYQVAEDTVANIKSNTCSPWVTFNKDGTLKNNDSVTAKDISTGLLKEITLNPKEEITFYMYVAIGKDINELNNAVQTVLSQDGEYWMNIMTQKYNEWLNEGKRTGFRKSKFNSAYDSILIAIKQATVPGKFLDGNNEAIKFAAMPATTNPSAYSYKVWARDSAVTAMAYDASGHLEEAESYWYWLADRQIKNDQGNWKKAGTFWTCYNIWDNSPVGFVEPEYDSIGMFLVGAYRHYEMLTSEADKESFLNKIWPAYRRSAEFVRLTINPNGFGIADCSIWEETAEYNTFTQALYIAGMDAAQMMAKAKGEVVDADNYNGAAATIRSAVQRDSTASTRGLWNLSEGRYNRAVSLDGKPNTLHDSSSDVLFAYGVIDAASSRAKTHIDSIIEYLGHDNYGVARYDSDGFYHRMTWDPGGNEALEDEPSWPQMAMWVAMYEIQSGYEAYKNNALRRLEWFVDRTALGYMPQGEAVSNVTKKAAISTMAEPITGAAYIMTVLAYLGQFDMRIIPDRYNAGANKTITISDGCINDWDQWYNVPYFNDIVGDNVTSDDDYDIEKVYITNDNNNIYIRIDNVSGTLPSYNADEKFAVYIYSEDYDYVSNYKKSISVHNGNLSRDMTYAIARYSNSNNYLKFSVLNSNWLKIGNITQVIAPQWEPLSGRIEVVIPFSQLASDGSVTDNSWANLDIVLVKQTDPVNDIWTDSDKLSLHYRKTGSYIEWLYGNVD